jgi:flagellar assembly protein FliH
MQEEPEFAIRPLEYPVMEGAPELVGLFSPEPSQAAGPDSRLAAREEALARQLEAVRQEGIEQGRHLAAAESSEWRQQRASELAAATEAFRISRDTYLAQVEKEVVQLALAIAERILHRESQLDPLLLSGAVRMALGYLADSTEVRLRVPPEQQELWTDMMRLMPGLAFRPQVVADAELRGCTAVLESSLGTADLSVQAQLEEIERGFFDRIETRGEGDRGQETGAAATGGSE